jgi:hypothetical protein
LYDVGYYQNLLGSKQEELARAEKAIRDLNAFLSDHDSASNSSQELLQGYKQRADRADIDERYVKSFATYRQKMAELLAKGELLLQRREDQRRDIVAAIRKAEADAVEARNTIATCNTEIAAIRAEEARQAAAAAAAAEAQREAERQAAVAQREAERQAAAAQREAERQAAATAAAAAAQREAERVAKTNATLGKSKRIWV